MRDLNDSIVSAIQSRAVRLEYFFKGVFSEGELRLWTGIGDMVLNRETYLGNGWLIGLPNIKEVLASTSYGVTVELSGIPAEVLSLVLNEHSSAVTGSLSLAWLDEYENIIGYDNLFSGDLDDISLKGSSTNTLVSLSYESKLIRMKSKRESRWTNAQALSQDPTDKGFEYVADIKNKRIYWGRPDTTRGR